MAQGEHGRASASVDRSSGDPQTGLQASPDPVSDVLEAVRLEGALFFFWEPAAPYGVGVADGARLSRRLLPATRRMLSFHIVTEGPCWAVVEGQEPLRLETGDTLVLPRGDAYKIASEPVAPTEAEQQESLGALAAIAGMEAPAVIRDGGQGPDRKRLVCGFLGCNALPGHPLLSALPAALRVPAPKNGGDPLTTLVQLALTESGRTRGGERCLLLRLSEVMFIEILRRYLASEAVEDAGWLRGLRDPLVGRALALLHGNVAHPWTLERLSTSAGASRSALAERFTRLVGAPPMQYLARWRMQLAAERLRHPGARVQAVALEVGYASESAFSRAFRREVGTSPATWRAGGTSG